MYDAGYHYHHGRLIRAPRHVYPEPDHGTAARYRSRRYTCRCDACRAAIAAYMRAYRAGRRGTDLPRSASCTSTRDADRPGVTARTLGVTGAGAGGDDDVTSPVYDGREV
jgi:hypothetical protein